MEQKYKHIADEEIESVKKTFAKKKESPPVEEVEHRSDPLREDLLRILTESGYASEEGNGPRIISPDEFGELGDFDQISLTYFADGVLTDENYYPIEDEDVVELIGEEALDHFGEYEEDSVFVRNEVKKVDFEILLDQRNYSDVRRTMPPQ